MKKSFLILICFLLISQLHAQIQVLKDLQDSVSQCMSKKSIDQELNSWYFGKTKKDYSIEKLNVYGFKADEIPTYSDSVYEARLDQLQSAIPLAYNDIIRRYIDLYTTKKRDQVEEMLGLANYYFPIFDEELARQGLPLELHYIPIIESALKTTAVSKSGATGLWQFMYATARIYDLQITSYIDERRDPYKLTNKAVTYFSDLYHVFGNWLFAIAAYNCGPGSLNKAITQSGYKTNFWEVYPYLPQETKGYIPAFIAASYVMHYNIEHNLYPKNIYCPGLLDTIHIERRLRMDVIANALQMEVSLLKELNPQYIKDIIPQSPTKEAYILRLPQEKAAKFYAHKDRIYRYQNYLDSKEKDEASAAKRLDKVNSFPSENTNSYHLIQYLVKSGDNVNLIADWFDCTVNDLSRWNKGIANSLYAGKKIHIYVPSHKAEHYQKINGMSFQEKQQLIGKVKEPITSDLITYTVKEGDTLWAIARQFPGVTPYDIMQLNEIDEESIKPGQQIKIKKK
ncbi:MAG: LysM peptidoglycan-binding domain-containing protein [Bacteroidetes bacterium]|mgnify:CR=1 FL=1|jgi:membrane-bound lytic murein transglycosylase D|nr:LysM peptidoglycan-binding domain-containing protein [Bacteroidota bacterium]MBT5529969.1 LysM peptidoglycan-binding domain-containing protein [Cytophagia bacterium]MBT3802739.1 LysM peptidoglycan-binding domain-containing protein [Bacteroidota bacterium]MBT3933586.1 LysM peptidoglycan-binding domain-containing protein [Bacteroidota bacterium]MBT4338750.1 LysM peptidoglycan-binding domain-containing protein [Bacteroidota bacterium]